MTIARGASIVINLEALPGIGAQDRAPIVVRGCIQLNGTLIVTVHPVPLHFMKSRPFILTLKVIVILS